MFSISRQGINLLCEAAFQGNEAQVRDLLKAGVSPNAPPDMKHTPLTLAAQKGHLSILKLLLNKGADKDQMNQEGYTAVYIASSYNQPSCLQELIAHDADCNATKPGNATPLYQAAAKGHVQCLQLLIKAHVDVDTQFNGISAISMAAQENEVKCLRLLLAAQAKFKPENSEEPSAPLYIAIQYDNSDCLRLFIEAGADCRGNSMQLTPLKHAINHGSLACVKMLLDADVPVEIADILGGMTALHYAAIHGNPLIMQALIEKGVELDVASIHGHTPLYIAQKCEHQKCVDLLLAAGANNHVSPTAVLFNAIDEGNLEIVLKMLPEVDVKNLPLADYAVSCNQPQCLAAVVNAGTDVNMKDPNGISPVYQAAIHNYHECLEILVAAKADLAAGYQDISPLYVAAQKGHVESLKLLIGAQANLELGAPSGTTPLYKAAVNGHLTCVELLIAAGANINVEIEGCTPVYMTASNNHVSCLRALLAAGASPECLNYSTPPLFRAAALGHDQCVELLIKAGANLDSKYTDTTPLWRAAFNGHYSCVKMLLKAGANKNCLNDDSFGAAWAAKTQGHQACFELIRDFENSGVSIIQRKNINVMIVPESQLGSSTRWEIPRNSQSVATTLSTGELVGAPADQRQNFPKITAGSITIIASDFGKIQQDVD